MELDFQPLGFGSNKTSLVHSNMFILLDLSSLFLLVLSLFRSFVRFWRPPWDPTQISGTTSASRRRAPTSARWSDPWESGNWAVMLLEIRRNCLKRRWRRLREMRIWQRSLGVNLGTAAARPRPPSFMVGWLTNSIIRVGEDHFSNDLDHHSWSYYFHIINSDQDHGKFDLYHRSRSPDVI